MSGRIAYIYRDTMRTPITKSWQRKVSNVVLFVVLVSGVAVNFKGEGGSIFFPRFQALICICLVLRMKLTNYPIMIWLDFSKSFLADER